MTLVLDCPVKPGNDNAGPGNDTEVRAMTARGRALTAFFVILGLDPRIHHCAINSKFPQASLCCHD